MANKKLITSGDMYNEDLAPVGHNERTVTPLGYGIIWFGIAVQITVFINFAQMINYFTVGQLLVGYVIGSILLAMACFVAQDIGLKYGISFATSVSAAFGYKGGKIVSVIRIIPSLMFFGINGYIGAVAINEIFKIVFNFENLFLALIINFTGLVLMAIKGVKGIEKFITWAAPILLITGGYMLYVVLTSYNTSFSELLTQGQLEGSKPTITTWLFIFALTVGVLSSVALGMNDYTKNGKVTSDKWFKSNKNFMLATFIGLIPSFVFFSILGNIIVVLSGRTDVFVVMSELIQEKSVIIAVLIQVFIVVAQGSTNSAANLLPSAYVVSSLAPRFIGFKTAIISFAVLALIIQPWAFDDLDYVVSLFSFTAGPAIAIIGVDYYVFRKRTLRLEELYDSKGWYNYTGGFNLVALAVYGISTLTGFIFFSDLDFYVATAMSGILYYIGGKLFSSIYPCMVENKSIINNQRAES